MKNKNELKEIKALTETICKTCNSYEETILAFKPYFINIADSTMPSFGEITKDYNIIDIANSKHKKGLEKDYEDTTKLIVDYYLYSKAPYGVVVILSQMEKCQDNYLQKDIDIFIKRN